MVEYAMQEGRESDTHDADKHQAAEERVARGEDLRPRSRQGADRAHAPENHRGIQKCINPSQASEPMISHHTNGQGNGAHPRGNADRHRHTAHEYGNGREFLEAAFKHGGLSLHALNHAGQAQVFLWIASGMGFGGTAPA